MSNDADETKSGGAHPEGASPVEGAPSGTARGAGDPPPPRSGTATMLPPPVGGWIDAADATPPKPLPEPRRRDARVVPAGIAGALVTDLAVRRAPWNNVAGTVFMVVMAAVLVGSGRIERGSAKIAALLAAALGFFLWIRTDPALVAFNIIGAVFLGWIAVVHSRGASVWDSGPVRLAMRGFTTFILGLETLADCVTEVMARQRRSRDSGPLSGELAGGLVRGAILAVPILLVLGLLLASADAVFASFVSLDTGINTGDLIGHAMLLGLGAVATITLLRLAARDLDAGAERPASPRLGRIEALVVLVGMDLLFAAFAIAQAVALTGGADRVLEDAGLTFKEYARDGFFQLLWVAGLSLLVLITLDAVTRHLESRKPVILASLIAVALTLVVVAVAFGRLWFYWNDNGLTPLRFYSSIFSVWIGIVFLLLAARILGVRAERSWLTAAIGLSGVVFLIGLNIVNPESVIAQDNIDRNHRPILFHMDKLTADGYVTLARGLDDLSPELREDVRREFCRSDTVNRDDDVSGLRFNLAEWRLDQEIPEVCGR